MKQQQGVALITVMLVLAVVVLLATQMSGRLIMQLQRTENIQLNQQAFWYAMSAEALAKRVLGKQQKDEPNVTHLSQAWAQGNSRFPVDNGEIAGELKDLHACLNLNALRATPSNSSDSANDGTKLNEAPARVALERLITNLAIEGVDEFEAEYMADALTDWLDSDNSIVSSGGAEDNDYAGKEFPYHTANHYLSSFQELRVIEHFSVPVIDALKPYVCVIPASSVHKININTLTDDKVSLLSALLDISENKALDIMSARDEKGFESVDDFLAIPEMVEVKLTDEQKQQFVVDSEYFKLTASAEFNQSYFNLNSTLLVLGEDNIAVVSRTIGRLNE